MKRKLAAPRNFTAKDIVDVDVDLTNGSTLTVMLKRAWRDGESACALISLRLDDYMALALAKKLREKFQRRAQRAAQDLKDLMESGS